MESVHSISHYLQCHYSHLGFGGSLGHVQGAAASAERGGGSKGSGRADQEGGNNELHLGYSIDGWKWVKGGWSGIMDYGLFFCDDECRRHHRSMEGKDSSSRERDEESNHPWTLDLSSQLRTVDEYLYYQSTPSINRDVISYQE